MKAGKRRLKPCRHGFDIMMTSVDDEQIYKVFENDIKQETAKKEVRRRIQKDFCTIDKNFMGILL